MDATVSFPENWSAPRELSTALPREVRQSGLGTFVATMRLVCFVAAVAAFVLLQNTYARQVAEIARLRTEGRETAGEVVRLWHEGKSSTPMVKYTFTAGARQLDGEASASATVWGGLQTGGPPAIRYVPADPTINYPFAWDRSPLPAWVPYSFAAMLALGALALWFALNTQARLLMEGLPAPGVVTKVYRVKGGWSTRYRFRMKDGSVRKGASQLPKRMQPGEVLCILYHPEKPGRNRPYPLSLYRLV